MKQSAGVLVRPVAGAVGLMSPHPYVNELLRIAPVSRSQHNRIKKRNMKKNNNKVCANQVP